MNNVFMKLCLFQNRGDNTSSIVLSKIDNDCHVSDSNSPSTYVSEFYSINPTFRPILPNTNIFCFSSEKGLRMIYDMYNIDDYKDCVQFVAWVSPTPNTTPLYISNNRKTLSFTKNIDDTSTDNSVTSQIYVLTKENIKNNQIYFKGEEGRCIPLHSSSNGQNIFECVTNNILELTEHKHGEDVSILDSFKINNTDTFEIKEVIICIVLFLITYISLILIKNKFSVKRNE